MHMKMLVSKKTDKEKKWCSSGETWEGVNLANLPQSRVRHYWQLKAPDPRSPGVHSRGLNCHRTVRPGAAVNRQHNTFRRGKRPEIQEREREKEN